VRWRRGWDPQAAAGRVLLSLLLVGTLAGCSLFRGRGRSAQGELCARKLMVPVAGVSPARVPDTFNAPRDGGRRRHLAIDILAPHGTPVLAADDGVVLAVKTNRLGGRVIYTTDPYRHFVYYYAHLQSWQPGTTPGQRIARGDVLGYVGSSGNADARSPHLHFQVRIYSPDDRYWTGPPLNPRACFARPGGRGV
jgi:murein DD-endopeptidase MepM/ murein hydrolase activator NlpD